jgi:hypothetical protein
MKMVTTTETKGRKKGVEGLHITTHQCKGENCEIEKELQFIP